MDNGSPGMLRGVGSTYLLDNKRVISNIVMASRRSNNTKDKGQRQTELQIKQDKTKTPKIKFRVSCPMETSNLSASIFEFLVWDSFLYAVKNKEAAWP